MFIHFLLCTSSSALTIENTTKQDTLQSTLQQKPRHSSIQPTTIKMLPAATSAHIAPKSVSPPQPIACFILTKHQGSSPSSWPLEALQLQAAHWATTTGRQQFGRNLHNELNLNLDRDISSWFLSLFSHKYFTLLDKGNEWIMMDGAFNWGIFISHLEFLLYE